MGSCGRLNTRGIHPWRSGGLHEAQLLNGLAIEVPLLVVAVVAGVSRSVCPVRESKPARRASVPFCQAETTAVESTAAFW